MSGRRVPQTDPWREPPRSPKGRRLVVAFIAVAVAVLVVVTVVAVARGSVIRLATTGNGVHLTFDGRVLTLPPPGPRGTRVKVRVSCLPQHPRIATTYPDVERTVRTRRRARFRFRRVLSGTLLCSFRTSRGASGAAWFGAEPETPDPVTPGYGVRTGETDDRGGAQFMLVGTRLTVHRQRAFTREIAVALVCGSDENTGLVSTTIVRRGQRRVTVNLGGDGTESLAWCLIEDSTYGGDIAVATLGPPAT